MSCRRLCVGVDGGFRPGADTSELPPNSVWGRLGISAGQAEAVPFGALPPAMGQITATANQVPVFPGSNGTAVPTSATTWFDNAYCNTVGYLIVRFTGAWTCAQGVPANPVWWGADVTGSSDATTAAQNCLNGVGAGGTCAAPPSAKLKILGNLTIPASTTLSCGSSLFDGNQPPSNLSSLPAIMLDSGHSISAGGYAAAVRNCFIYRNGMTFPAANSSAFAGIALQDANNGSFTVVDDLIVGFATCIYATGVRPYLVHDYVDCAGATSGTPYAAVEIDNGNTDIGYIDKLKIQPIATGNALCPSVSLRPGTGLRINGINFVGDAVVQNFQVADIEIDSFVQVDKLWTDYYPGCTQGTSVGLEIGAGGQIFVNQAILNGSHTGLLLTNNDGIGASSAIGSLFLNEIGQDCIVVGGTGVNGGFTAINFLATNAGATVDCGRYLVNYLDTTISSRLDVLDGNAFLINGGAAPYFKTTISGPSLGAHLNVAHLRTDLAAGTNPFSGFAALTGAAPSLQGVAPTLGTVTGLGSGSAALFAGSDVIKGVVTLSPTGSPSASGNVELNMPVGAGNIWVCSPAYEGGSTSWPSGTSTSIVGIDASHLDLSWATGSALTAGQTYNLTYQCAPQ